MSNADFKLTNEKIQLDGRPSVTVFALKGWLDAQSEDKLFTAAQEEHAQGARHLLIDLEEVNTLTSAGIRALQKIYLLFNPGEHTVHSSRLKLCNAQPQVYHVLSLTGFLHSAPMYEDRQAALNAFSL
jgi:anti-anti-sigma factor